LPDLPGVKPERWSAVRNGDLIIDGRCPARHEGWINLLCEYGVGDFYRLFDQASTSTGRRSPPAQRRRPDGPPAEGGAVKPKKITVKGE